jgi:tRNA G18 (ribose-2'-O)-methylase SpoU
MRKLQLDELGRVSHDQFAHAQKRPIVLVLDNIRSGLNVGSIFRTADAFALEKIILCGITPQPPHREILKTALGATETIPWEYTPDPLLAIEMLKRKGFQIWAVEQTDASSPLTELQWQSTVPIALVLGNEVHGVSDTVLSALDHAIEIPQFGTKHSLNVAVSAGIVVWHVVYAALRKDRLEGHTGFD